MLTNILNYCWGGTKTPWTFNDGNICGYTSLYGSVYPVAPYGTRGAIVEPARVPRFGHSTVPEVPVRAGARPRFDCRREWSQKMPLQFYLTANVKL